MNFLKPRFSILILTYNRLNAVRACLASLEPSIWPDVEVLVLDNGSTDGTVELIRELPLLLRGAGKAEVTLSQENLGVAGGRAALLTKAKGDIVVLLDSDVVIRDPHWLDTLAAALEPENVGLCGPAGSFVQWTATGADYVQAPPGECDVVSGWCQAIKREVLTVGARIDLGYGPFWEEDSDFCLQVRQVGWDVVCTGDIGVQHSPGLSGDAPGQREVNLARFRSQWQGKELIRAEGGY